MGKINNYILDMMGFSPSTSAYSKADWDGKASYKEMTAPKPVKKMSNKEVRELEKRKTLPKRTQLEILDRD